MSRYTDFRDRAILEVGNSLIRLLIDKIVRSANARADANLASPPSILGYSDSSAGATTGSTGEAAGSTGVEHARSRE